MRNFSKPEMFARGVQLLRSRTSIYSTAKKYGSNRLLWSSPDLKSWQIREKHLDFRNVHVNVEEEDTEEDYKHYRSTKHGQPDIEDLNKQNIKGVFNVFEQCKGNLQDQEPLDHLQPSNLCPFQSTLLPFFPSTLKTSTFDVGSSTVEKDLPKANPFENISLRKGFHNFGQDTLCPYYQIHRSLKDRLSTNSLIQTNNDKSIKSWPSFSETLSHKDGLTLSTNVDSQSKRAIKTEECKMKEIKTRAGYLEESDMDHDNCLKEWSTRSITGNKAPEINAKDIKQNETNNSDKGVTSNPSATQVLANLAEKRLLRKKYDHFYDSHILNTGPIKQFARHITITPNFSERNISHTQENSKKHDSCENPRKKKSKVLRHSENHDLPQKSRSAKGKLCGIRADDFLRKKQKKLPTLELNYSVYDEPTEAPSLRRPKNIKSRSERK